jgi:DNA-binding XRE family transcriptional regulator
MAWTKLKEERNRMGMRQYRLASLVGISSTELNYYENGRKRCPANLRYKIAEILEKPVDVLFPIEQGVA